MGRATSISPLDLYACIGTGSGPVVLDVRPGKVALWSEADSITHFDAISITTLDDRE